MRNKYRLSNNLEIEVENLPFACGGEGDLYRILSPASFKPQVLKIYKPDKRTQQRENKLNFLVKNPPTGDGKSGHVSIIWPTHLAYEAGKFAGYTMPTASGIKLEFLCHARLPKFLGTEWNRFELRTPGAIGLRIAICFNIAAAISQIHAYGNYVLVDLKPDNIIIQPNGKISIIDIDSTEVIQANRLLFPAHVLTPEYTPPEFYTSIKKIDNTLIDDTWDRFSLAVIFYRLLFGIHPYTGSLKPPFHNLSNTSDLIEKGFFPKGSNQAKFSVIPKPHHQFDKFENNIKVLFLAVFEKGHGQPSLRPSADDWCRCLSPTPRIKIDRQLPSSKLQLFAKSRSTRLVLPKAPQLQYAKPNYIDLSLYRTFLQKLFVIFYEPPKTKKRNVLRIEQQLCDSIIGEIETLNEKSRSLRQEYARLQEQIIETEAATIDNTYRRYSEHAKAVDEKAKLLFQKESEDLQRYDQDFQKKYAAIELEVKNAFISSVQSTERSYQLQLDEFSRQLKLIEDEETTKLASIDNKLKTELNTIKLHVQALEKEITKRIDTDAQAKLSKIQDQRTALDKEVGQSLITALEVYQASFTAGQLCQYRIASDAHIIFTDSYANPEQIARALSMNGISTAADFSAVNESGFILTSQGRWIKVSGVASYRAKCLANWRSRMERNLPVTPPQSLPYTKEAEIKSQFQSKYETISQQEQTIRAEAVKRKTNISQQLKADLERASNKEQQITNTLLEEKGTIAAEYNLKKNSLIRQQATVKQQSQLTIAERKRHFEKTANTWMSEMESLKKDREAHIERTKKVFDEKHTMLVIELNRLDLQYHKEQSKILVSSQLELRSNFEALLTQNKNIVDALNQINIKANKAFDKLNQIQIEFAQTA